MVWLYQAQLGRAGLPLWSFGIVHAALTLAQMALLSRIGAVEALVGGARRLVRLTALVPPFCLGALALTASPAPSVALSIAAATLGFVRLPLFSGVLNARIPSERRATVLSAVSALRTLGIAALYPAFGFLVDRSLPLALAVLGALGLAVAVLAAAPASAFEPERGGAAAAAP